MAEASGCAPESGLTRFSASSRSQGANQSLPVIGGVFAASVLGYAALRATTSRYS